jgi:hypothetical protein
MNILSFDVGIKNLAYCQFFIYEKKYEISQWGVINLVDTKKNCLEQKKNGKICNKNAKFFKKNKYYCKIHAKNKKYKIPSNELKPGAIKKLTSSQIKKKCKEFGIKYEKKILKKKILLLLEKYIDVNYLSFVNTVNAKDISIVSLGITIKQKFDALFNNIKLDHIIIENQISPIANRMKTIQGMIIQHFIEKNFTNIKQISAFNKLKEFLGEHQKTTYNQRKKLGIQSCSNIICNNQYFNKWDQFFLTHKKKDDLADSFLQGWWYLKNLNII